MKAMQANWIGECSGCYFDHVLRVSLLFLLICKAFPTFPPPYFVFIFLFTLFKYPESLCPRICILISECFIAFCAFYYTLCHLELKAVCAALLRFHYERKYAQLAVALLIKSLISFQRVEHQHCRDVSQIAFMYKGCTFQEKLNS